MTGLILLLRVLYQLVNRFVNESWLVFATVVGGQMPT